MPSFTRTLPFKIILCIIVAEVLGGLGAVVTVGSLSSWYQELQAPPGTPPNSVFGPVWTVLYIMMGVAAWLVWRIDGYRAASGALALFLVQLVLNSLWTWLFFVWHLGALALAEILLLWLLIVANLVAFYRLRALAGWLLLPYLLWVSFASVLTCAMWQLNPGTLG